ncbi:MAG TPA: hypothetical protein VIL49_16430 [Capillimicrobium sp.]
MLRLTSPLAALLAALTLAVLAVAPAPPARAAEPGVVLTGDFASSRQLDSAVRAGARWVRIFMYRNAIEIGPGALKPDLLAAYRRTAERYAAHGIRTQLVLVGTPAWESGSADHLVPPDPDGFARFAGLVAARLPDSVGAYEIWNESDAEKWWHGDLDPAGYARLLRAAYPAIKQAAPHAEVLVGGLTGNNYPYLEGLYAAGAQGSFDAVSVHLGTACGIASPYSYMRDPGGRVSRWSFLGYREVLRTMDAAGDGGKGIWLTEFGWSSSGAVCDQGVWAGQKPGGVAEDVQARYLAEAWHCIAADPRVRGAIWFDLQDLAPSDEPDHRFGLTRVDGTAKPAFAAFQAAATVGDTLTGPCGDFQPPAIGMLALGDEGVTGRWAQALRIKVSAGDDSGVARIAMTLDGERIPTVDEPKGALVMVGDLLLERARGLEPGPHTLEVVARDVNGNEATQSFALVKAAAQPAKAQGQAKPARQKRAKRKAARTASRPAAGRRRGAGSRRGARSPARRARQARRGHGRGA